MVVGPSRHQVFFILGVAAVVIVVRIIVGAIINNAYEYDHEHEQHETAVTVLANNNDEGNTVGLADDVNRYSSNSNSNSNSNGKSKSERRKNKHEKNYEIDMQTETNAFQNEDVTALKMNSYNDLSQCPSCPSCTCPSPPYFPPPTNPPSLPPRIIEIPCKACVCPSPSPAPLPSSNSFSSSRSKQSHHIPLANSLANLDNDDVAAVNKSLIFSPLYSPPASLSSLFDEKFSRDFEIDPIIELYITQHGRQAMRQVNHKELCEERQFVVAQCCEPNFGSSLFRMLASVKAAMYFNKTFILKEDERATHYFKFPFMSFEELNRRLAWHKCPIKWDGHSSFDMESQVQRVHFHANWHEIPKDMMSEDDEVACNGEREQFREFYETYRCGNVSVSEFKKHWLYEVGDDFTFFKMLELNPSYRSFPVHYLPSGLEFSRRLFTLLVVQHPQLERVTAQFVDGRAFDVALHLRGTIAKKNIEWDLKPGLARVQESIVEIFEREGTERSPIRVLVAASYSNMTAMCLEIVANCSAFYPVPGCTCEFFDPFVHEARYGLPPDILSIEEPGGFDWGLYPPWVAITNVFAFRYTRHYIWSLCYSRFGQMISVAANMKISDGPGHVHECWGNTWTWLWPF